MGKDMLTGHPPRGSAHTNRKDWNAMTLCIYRTTSRRTLFRFACSGGLKKHTQPSTACYKYKDALGCVWC